MTQPDARQAPWRWGWGWAIAVFALALALGTAWWEAGGRELYGRLFVSAARAFYEAVGLPRVALAPRERFFNVVVFLALMVATPGLGWRRRLGGAAAGLGGLLASHVALSGFVWWWAGGLATFPLPVAIVSDALPFAFWVVIARDEVSQWLVRPPPAADAAPDESPDASTQATPDASPATGRDASPAASPDADRDA